MRNKFACIPRRLIEIAMARIVTDREPNAPEQMSVECGPWNNAVDYGLWKDLNDLTS